MQYLTYNPISIKAHAEEYASQKWTGCNFVMDYSGSMKSNDPRTYRSGYGKGIY